MNMIVFGLWFAESFCVYTFLRSFDVRSTAKLAERIDLQKHEINPTITWLATRLGLKNAFRVTWLVIGFGVATADAYINQGFTFGIPIYALIVGFAHVLAAAHNTRVSYVVDKIGVKEFEREHEEHMRELANLDWRQRIGLVARSDPTSILMLVLALPLAIALGYAMVATELFTIVALPEKLLIIPLNTAFCFVLAMVLIQPAFALGPLILSRRYSRQFEGRGAVEDGGESGSVHLELPVAVVAEALEAARTGGESVVKITVPITPEE